MTFPTTTTRRPTRYPSLIAIAILWQCRMYRALWRHPSVADLQAILIYSFSAILLCSFRRCSSSIACTVEG